MFTLPVDLFLVFLRALHHICSLDHRSLTSPHPFNLLMRYFVSLSQLIEEIRMHKALSRQQFPTLNHLDFHGGRELVSFNFLFLLFFLWTVAKL